MKIAPVLSIPLLAAAAALLFIVDLLLPFGVAAGFPYVALVFLAAWMPGRRVVMHLAVLSSVLIIVGGVLSPAGGVTWMGVANRIIGVAVVWITACLIQLRRRTEERLLRANRELNGFVHTVSHDLRSPLSPIIGYADYLRMEYEQSLDREGMEALDEIAGHGRRMLALLDDLLQLATVGSLQRPPGPVDVEAVVRQVLAGWLERAREAGCELSSGKLPSAAVPESLLTQVFDNLVGNAVRYAGGGRIEVGGERRAERVRYFVRDHGRGVPPEERERIFEIFNRGSSAASLEGTGIGLATVQKIAQHYDGRAWVEETPGGGSTFLVEFSETGESKR